MPAILSTVPVPAREVTVGALIEVRPGFLAGVTGRESGLGTVTFTLAHGTTRTVALHQTVHVFA